MKRLGAVLAALLMPLMSCVPSLPLGGIAPGRGEPIGRGVQVGTSLGVNPELMGTIPEVFSETGDLQNPIPTSDSRHTTAGAWDPLTLAVGFTDWFDVGWSRSRGLNGVVRMVGKEGWSWSLSPAWYYYSSDVEGRAWGHGERLKVVNYNLTTLLTGTLIRQSEVDLSASIKTYLGAGRNWHEAAMGRDERARSGTGTSWSGVLGVAGEIERENGPRRATRRVMRISVEGSATWIRQRDGRRDIVPGFRVFFSMGLHSLRPE